MNRMLRYVSLILLFINIVILIMLYVVAYRYDYNQRMILKVRKNLDQEHNAGLAIKAEWSYLNKPITLAYLAKTRLDLQPIKPQQFKKSILDK